MSLLASLTRPFMHGYNFTERTRHVLQLAREEAQRLHHEYVGTEHILLGILHNGDGVATAALFALNVNADALAGAIVRTVSQGSAPPSGPDLPYTSRAKKVLELAMSEARELHHSYVGTEHLLIGLVREGNGVAAQVLSDAGVTLDRLRAQTLRLVGQERMPPQPDTAPHSAPSVPQTSPVDLAREEEAWRRLGRALEVCARTGTTPTLTLEGDGTLTVPLGPNLVVSVHFPPHVRLRRADAPASAGAPNESPNG